MMINENIKELGLADEVLFRPVWWTRSEEGWRSQCWRRAGRWCSTWDICRRSSTGCTWHMWSCYGWRYHIYNWTWLYMHLSGSLKMMWSVKSAKTRSNTSEGYTYNNKSAPLKTNLYQWHLLIIFIFSYHLWPCKRNWRACSLHFRQGCIGSLAQRSTRLSWWENIITLMIVCWCDDGDLYN